MDDDRDSGSGLANVLPRGPRFKCVHILTWYNSAKRPPSDAQEGSLYIFQIDKSGAHVPPMGART